MIEDRQIWSAGSRLNRLLSWAHRRKSPAFIRFLLKLLLHVELPLRDGGTGINLPHPWGVVIHPNAVVGERVVVYQGVTVGRKKGGVKAGIPTLGDDVVIYPNAVIVGAVRIGNRAVVGAGAVVLDDVPDGATVAGNPARILREADQ